MSVKKEIVSKKVELAEAPHVVRLLTTKFLRRMQDKLAEFHRQRLNLELVDLFADWETKTLKYFNVSRGFGFLMDPEQPDQPDQFVHAYGLRRLDFRCNEDGNFVSLYHAQAPLDECKKVILPIQELVPGITIRYAFNKNRQPMWLLEKEYQNVRRQAMQLIDAENARRNEPCNSVKLALQIGKITDTPYCDNASKTWVYEKPTLLVEAILPDEPEFLDELDALLSQVTDPTIDIEVSLENFDAALDQA